MHLERGDAGRAVAADGAAYRPAAERCGLRGAGTAAVCAAHRRAVAADQPRVASRAATHRLIHPTTAWNYALELGDGEVGGAPVVLPERRIGSPVLSPGSAAGERRRSGRRVAGWTVEGGSVGPMPHSTVAGDRGAEELT